MSTTVIGSTTVVAAAPAYLADDCRLLSDIGRRPLLSNSNDMRKLLMPRTHNKLGDRSFSAAGPRLWNDLPPGLRRPGLTFDSFRQSMKTHLFGDRSAEWLFWMYRRYINKLIYLSIISNTQQHPTSWYTQTIAILSWHYFAAMSVALIDSCQTHYIQAGAPIPNSRDATLPFPPFPLSPLLTGVRGYKPHNFLELKTLVGEFQSISDIKINTFTIQGPALQNILRFVTWLS